MFIVIDILITYVQIIDVKIFSVFHRVFIPIQLFQGIDHYCLFTVMSQV